MVTAPAPPFTVIPPVPSDKVRVVFTRSESISVAPVFTIVIPAMALSAVSLRPVKPFTPVWLITTVSAPVVAFGVPPPGVELVDQ